MAYRDDRSALEARRNELKDEAAELEGRIRAMGSQIERKLEVHRELEEIEAKLARSAAARRRVLDELRVASPCGEDWEKMTGDARVRFCARCEKSVYNISELSRAEAEALLAEHESSLCIRMYKRADGTLITNDCPVGATKKRRRLKVLSAVGAAAASAGAFAWWATRPSVDRMGAQVMGEMALLQQVPQATPPLVKEPPHALMGAPTVVMGKRPVESFTPEVSATANPPRKTHGDVKVTRRPGTPTSR